VNWNWLQNEGQPALEFIFSRGPSFSLRAAPCAKSRLPSCSCRVCLARSLSILRAAFTARLRFLSSLVGFAMSTFPPRLAGYCRYCSQNFTTKWCQRMQLGARVGGWRAAAYRDRLGEFPVDPAARSIVPAFQPVRRRDAGPAFQTVRLIP